METQQSIGAWQVATFGSLPSLAVGIDRAYSEMRELCATFTRLSAAEEMADVMIVLLGTAEQFGIDLQAEVDAKMQINRNRQWNVTSEGTGYHIKETR